MDKTDLGLKSGDIITSTLKSAAGVMPGIGPLLSEIIGSIIPNQRIDRLEKFVKILDEKIGLIEIEVANCLSDDECVRLFEEAFYQASRATSDERRSYIASILKNGLCGEEVKYNESIYLLKLLEELNDIEVIWLRFYLVPILNGDKEFRSRHESILKKVIVTIGCDKNTQVKASLQYSYKIHLKNLGLIKSHIKLSKDKMPVFDRITGEPQLSYTEISSLGRLLLRHIGFEESEDQDSRRV